MKRLIKKICILLCIVLLSVNMGNASVEATSTTEIEESIKEKEDAIGDAEEEMGDLEQGITDMEALIASLESSKSDLQTYVQELDLSLIEISEKIIELENLITNKEAEIAETEVSLEEAMLEEVLQYKVMKDRIQFMYEQGNTFYTEILFGLDNFGNYLNKMLYIEMLSEYDQNLLEEYQLNCEYISLCKEELEIEQNVLAEAKELVEEEEANLESLIATKESEINSYEADINNKEATIAQYEEDLAAQTAVIAELEKSIEEQKALLDTDDSLGYDGGMFKWPAPSYTYISSDYGYRMHPILNEYIFHSGVDMAAPGGSQILAAYGGQVVAASYSSSMGNYIMIDHGDELYTIYMHASALYVSVGDTVTRGQHIAAVGSTGLSTGNHLHFGVRLNGEYVSPWNYLSQ